MAQKTRLILERLSGSKFRKSFKLGTKEKKYIKIKGWKIIEKHTDNFIKQRLAPAEPKNDGKQTPYRGHPVFIAQHATATCCRNCLARWHKIKKGKKLTSAEINFIISLIIKWLKINYKNSPNNKKMLKSK